MQRYKDCDPKETVEHIKGILANLDIHPEGELLSFADRFYSMRIEDSATGLGTNGKGVSPDLAWASAYGEFMERLQNDFLLRSKITWHKIQSSESIKPGDFAFWPDEHLTSFDMAVESCSDVLRDMEQNYVRGDIIGAEGDRSASREEALSFWKSIVGETVAMVPYYCVGTESLVDLPEDIIRKLEMSNGLASGNTPEEAIVEGCSEVCERYAKARIVNEELCPPPIPRDFIEKHCPEQAAMLRVIEERSPELNVIVLDASLGEGIPTVCVLFINRRKGTIRPKFGAHPTLSIALERCMTEQYQGYAPDNGIDNDVFTSWDAWSRKTTHYVPMAQSAFTCDRYAVPDRILAGKHDWEFDPWGIDTSYTNKIGARQLVELLRAIGGEVYIRDNGYLGVPTYRVYVPVAGSLPTPGGDSALLSERYGVVVADAIVAYSAGDLNTAAELLRMHGGQRSLCAAQELLCRCEGMPEEQRDKLLEVYFGAGCAAYAKAVWRSDDVAASMNVFTSRENWLKSLDGKNKPGKSPYRDARARLAARLKELKISNPVDQMNIAEAFK